MSEENELQKEKNDKALKELKGERKSLQSSIEALNSQITTLEAEKAKIQESSQIEANTLKTLNTALQSQVNSLVEQQATLRVQAENSISATKAESLNTKILQLEAEKQLLEEQLSRAVGGVAVLAEEPRQVWQLRKVLDLHPVRPVFIDPGC